MAARLLARLRHQLLNSRRDILEPLSSTPSHFRRFSDVAQSLPENPSSSDEKFSAFPNQGNSTMNGAKSSINSSLNEAELAKFSAIAETWCVYRYLILTINVYLGHVKFTFLCITSFILRSTVSIFFLIYSRLSHSTSNYGFWILCSTYLLFGAMLDVFWLTNSIGY